MSQLVFPCGCSFNVDDGEQQTINSQDINTFPLKTQLDVYNIPHNCSLTWDLLSRGDTKGVFQLEGHLGKTWSYLIKPNNLEELGALVSLLRPGCLRAMSGDPPKSMTQRYRDRKHKEEDVDYFGVDALQPILDKTYGILCFQEQSMQISVSLAGFSEQEADILRKAIGKKKPEIMSQVKVDFLSGCITTDIVSKEQAEEIFGWIQESQRYSFNKSHAICYGEGSYWTAYTKAHFPIQFCCSYLDGANNKQNKFEEIAELINDAKLHDIVVNVPDIRDASQICYIKNNQIYFGLLEVRQIGKSAIDKILVHLREAQLILDIDIKDWSWLDYLFYFSGRVSQTVSNALIGVGALDFLDMGRMRMLYEFERWNRLTAKEQEWIYSRQYCRMNPDNEEHDGQKWDSLYDALIACGNPKKEGGGCHNVNRVNIVRDMAEIVRNPPHCLDDHPHYIAFNEEQYLGISITCSVVDGCDDAAHANATCKEVVGGQRGYTVLAVVINSIKEITTKATKQKMAFLTCSDHTCAVDNLVCFPSDWVRYKNILTSGNTVLIHCERSIDKSRDSLIIKKVWQI